MKKPPERREEKNYFKNRKLRPRHKLRQFAAIALNFSKMLHLLFKRVPRVTLKTPYKWMATAIEGKKAEKSPNIVLYIRE